VRHETNASRWLASERVICPCGCIFQAVSESDECWACGRSAGATKAEEDRIVASIRGLPETSPRTFRV
jgi:hypothetical protein